MHINNFKDVTVLKPWGYEFLLYENINLAIWFLYLEHQKSTSFHCHSKKLTGLISLEGKIKVSFFENSQIIEPLQKIMIRERLFHSSKSTTEGGSFLIEVETPVEKGDLIRYEDSYGREGLPYESSKNYRNRTENEIFIKDEEGLLFLNNNKFEIKNILKKEDLLFVDDKDIIIVLNGHFTKKIKDNFLNLLSPGDCLYGSIYKKIISIIEKIDENTKVMVISGKNKC
jgi:mannose-6-phosphate isomerase-like protein (cupin superfamily)